MGNRPGSSNRKKRPTIRNVKGATIVVTTTNTTATTPATATTTKTTNTTTTTTTITKKNGRMRQVNQKEIWVLYRHTILIYFCASLCQTQKDQLSTFFMVIVFGIFTILKCAIQIDLLNKTIDLSVFA